MRFGFRVSGSGFWVECVECSRIRVWGSRFRILSLRFQVSGFGFRVSGFGVSVEFLRFGVWGSRFRVLSFWCRVSGFGFRVSSFGIRFKCAICRLVGWYTPVMLAASAPFDFIRTSMHDQCSGLTKITTQLDHISHCKTTSGTNQSSRWTHLINTRRDSISAPHGWSC